MERLVNKQPENSISDLFSRLERANESLAFYKTNKEICMRDLQKLELENSALAEENEFLKKRIVNVEKNASMMADRSMERLSFLSDAYSVRMQIPPLSTQVQNSKRPVRSALKVRECDIQTDSTTFRDSKKAKNSNLTPSLTPRLTPSSSKRQLGLSQNALLKSSLLYNL